MSRTGLGTHAARSGCGRAIAAAAWCMLGAIQLCAQQTPAAPSVQEQVQQLRAAVVQTQSDMQAYQQRLNALQQRLAALERQLNSQTPASPADASPGAESAAAALEELKERQAISESQLATHEVSKVETESKYPLKLSGMILFNGFVNTRRVDTPASPAYALSGGGSTGFSVRQTILGFEARGPHIFGASSYADLHADFFASEQQSSYAPAGLMRLRTAHAGLRWQNTEFFFAQDHTILAPYVPSSLVAVAQPELAWSGFLWSWNPQIGVKRELDLSERRRLTVQAALMDEGDPQLPNAAAPSSGATMTERSRWPGVETRVAYGLGDPVKGFEIGAGGYYASHRTADDYQFDGWAGTLDLRLPLPAHFQFVANAYRGAAVGGLGGGGYSDYFVRWAGGDALPAALDTVGGFGQLKDRFSERLEFNAGFGIDNPFAAELRAYRSGVAGQGYAGLARNRSAYGNVIFTPSRYLLFSLEYRKVWTNLTGGPAYPADIVGIGAGYSF